MIQFVLVWQSAAWNLQQIRTSNTFANRFCCLLLQNPVSDLASYYLEKSQLVYKIFGLSLLPVRTVHTYW